MQLMHDFLERNSDGGTVMFSVKNGNGHGIYIPFGIGDDSGLAALQESAVGTHDHEQFTGCLRGMLMFVLFRWKSPLC
jgi:hypothetical protein